MRTVILTLSLVLAWLASAEVRAWSEQGHRIVGLIAAARLTPVAASQVQWLLDGQTLADVAEWADDFRSANYQTFAWHFVNIAPEANAYDRERDCPRQPGVTPGSAADTWRDCVVDRILYHQQQLANTALDRADRAIALKFLVHFVGDVHQPFHASGVERGGNGIAVSWLGSPTCGSTATSAGFPCNLHSIWDTQMVARRGLTDAEYAADLERQITERGWDQTPLSTPAEWATESHRLAQAAMLPQQGNADEAYYKAQAGVVEQRMAVADIRLAALLNDSLRDGAR